MSSSHHGASAPPPPSQLLSLFLNPQPGGAGESSTYSLNLDASESGGALNTNTAHGKTVVPKRKDRQGLYNKICWTAEEHNKFLDGLHKYDKNYRQIALHVGTKSHRQVASHAQKHFMKEQKEKEEAGTSAGRKRKRDPDEDDEKNSTDLQDAQTLQARGKFRSFEDARSYVRTLGLKSVEEWQAWTSSGARPHDIPNHPETTYESSGWLSYGDFLGYAVGKQARKTKESTFRTFEDARTYVHTLGLKSHKEWKEWSSSGARPHDIPGAPDVMYKSSGWTSLGDFLGYAARSFRSFEDARSYVRTLGLKSWKEWWAWSKSGARPHDIPSNPNVTYASSGWLSYGDFLGYAVGKAAVSTENVCIELIALPRSLKGETNDITPPQISQRFIVFDTPMLEMRYAAMYVAQMLREEGSKGVNDGDIELRLLSGEVVSLSEQKIRDLLVFPKLEASSNSAAGSIPLLKVHYRHVHAGVKEE